MQRLHAGKGLGDLFGTKDDVAGLRGSCGLRADLNQRRDMRRALLILRFDGADACLHGVSSRSAWAASGRLSDPKAGWRAVAIFLTC